MKNATIIYLLSEQGRKDSLLQGGDGKKVQVVETEATPEILELAIVNETGEIYLGVGCDVNPYGQVQNSCNKPIQGYKLEKWSYGEPKIESFGETVYFDTIQTPEQLIIHEKNRLEKLEESRVQAETDLIPAMEKYEKAKAEKEAKKAEEKAIKEVKEAEERKIREANIEKNRQKEEAERLAEIEYENQRAEWIKAHGSQYLKDCLDLNLKANREYVLERARLEHPGFTVDFYDNAGWDNKVSPSVEAVAELKRLRNLGLNADIVSLTSPPKDNDEDDDDEDEYYEDDYNNDFEEQEAVVIRKYLGKYDLIKTDF